MYSETRPELMKWDNYTHLNALCRDHTEIFSMTASPTIEQLREFEPLFMGEPYVRGLFLSGELEKALGRLEKGFRAGEDNKGEKMGERGALGPNKRLERRVRLVHRLAKITGPWGEHQVLYTEKEMKQKRREAARHLDKALKPLTILLADEFFREGVARSSGLEALRGLSQRIKLAVEAIENAQPRYPCKRRGTTHEAHDSSRSELHQKINRLADACFRIYGDCTPAVILSLTDIGPPVAVIGKKEIREFIKEAMVRKIDLFKRRIPSEVNESADLAGEWLLATPPLTAPWMDGYDSAV